MIKSIFIILLLLSASSFALEKEIYDFIKFQEGEGRSIVQKCHTVNNMIGNADSKREIFLRLLKEITSPTAKSLKSMIKVETSSNGVPIKSI